MLQTAPNKIKTNKSKELEIREKPLPKGLDQSEFSGTEGASG
jgi:hypothetical protein